MTKIMLNPNIKVRLMAAGLSLVLGASAVAGCAAAGPYNPYALAHEQLGEIDQICGSTVGLSPDDPHYGVCVYSLSAQTEEQNRIAQLAKADTQCREDGAASGAPLALCVLDRTRVPAPATVLQPPAHAVGADIGQRQQIACAQIGLDPASGAFDACVAEMRDGFAKVDAPVTN
jgi:hypothetical protein